MENNNNKPKLRFPEFTDPWEQRKLGDVFEEYSEKNHEELPPLSIIQGRGTIRRDESDRNLQFDKKSLLNYKMVEKDDFIVHLRSFEGGLEKSNFTGIISPAYHTLHGNGADSRFYYSYFRSHNFINIELKPHVYGVRDGRSIDMAGMKTINIPFTSLNEQKKIGDFIESLDTIITLHQRKLEHLKDKKKELLQKMFPKEGEKFPELRFPGFTDPWEQRKFGEVIDYIVDNRGKNPKYYCESGIPVIDNYMIKNTLYPDLTYANRFVDENIYENFIRKYNKVDDILITLVGNGIGNITLFPVDKAVIIQNTLGLRTSENKRFIFFLLMSKNRKIITLDRGMAQPSIRQDEVLDIEIQIPNLKEQDMIGAYFSNLDNLITIHQRKLERLQQQKKGLLQQMFI